MTVSWHKDSSNIVQTVCIILEECLKPLRTSSIQAPISSFEASIYPQIINLLQVIFPFCLLMEALRDPLGHRCMIGCMDGWMVNK